MRTDDHFMIFLFEKSVNFINFVSVIFMILLNSEAFTSVYQMVLTQWCAMSKRHSGRCHNK